jgi:hypothetical protein
MSKKGRNAYVDVGIELTVQDPKRLCLGLDLTLSTLH